MILADELRIRNLVQMVEAGYRDNIVISHDHVVCLLGRVGPELYAALPNWSLKHIFEYIIPLLIERGLTKEDIDKTLIDNPRRLLPMLLQKSPLMVWLAPSELLLTNLVG
jgi:phosphotriesterase-related protein